jgi:hypothetical protein
LLDPHLRGRAPDALGIADAFSDASARVLRVQSLANALIAVEDGVPSTGILDHALGDGDSLQLLECLNERNIPYWSTVGTLPETGKAVYAPKTASPNTL